MCAFTEIVEAITAEQARLAAQAQTPAQLSGNPGQLTEEGDA